MTREIKFRAWDGNIMFVPQIDLAQGNLNYYLSDIQKPWKLMQFTGLKDKNGKEIYEGDIIKHEIDEEGNLGFGLGVELCPVVWCQSEQAIYRDDCKVSGWFIKTRIYNNGKDCEYLPIVETLSPEVIGNIYENPDLLR